MTIKWQQGLDVVESDWPHSIAHPPKPPIRRKDLGDISYRNRIIALCLKYHCHGNKGR